MVPAAMCRWIVRSVLPNFCAACRVEHFAFTMRLVSYYVPNGQFVELCVEHSVPNRPELHRNARKDEHREIRGYGKAGYFVIGRSPVQVRASAPPAHTL
jgi:hypothetical protein